MGFHILARRLQMLVRAVRPVTLDMRFIKVALRRRRKRGTYSPGQGHSLCSLTAKHGEYCSRRRVVEFRREGSDGVR